MGASKTRSSLYACYVVHGVVASGHFPVGDWLNGLAVGFNVRCRHYRVGDFQSDIRSSRSNCGAAPRRRAEGHALRRGGTGRAAEPPCPEGGVSALTGDDRSAGQGCNRRSQKMTTTPTSARAHQKAGASCLPSRAVSWGERRLRKAGQRCPEPCRAAAMRHGLRRIVKLKRSFGLAQPKDHLVY